MEYEMIKKTIQFGNSSAVILPSTWKYKKVKIKLVERSIVQDVIKILSNREILKNVIGIYLVGSYARDEESEESDIDVLIITDSLDKQIKEGIYEVILISEKKFDETIKKSLYLASLVKESKTIINEKFIKGYKEKNFEIPFKKYIREIKSIIKLNEDIINLDKETGGKISDGVIYSIILRLRELYLIDCILTNKMYSKKEFLKLIENENLYNAYLRVKNNKVLKENSNPEEVKKIIDIAKKFIAKWEKRIK